MRKLVLIGAGGHSRAALAAVISSGIYQVEMIGDTQNNSEYSGEEIIGIPVVGLDVAYSYAMNNSTPTFVAVGSNSERRKIHTSLIDAGLEITSIIHPSAIIGPCTKIGAGSFLAASCHIGPEVEIGESTIVNTMCNVEHESTVGKFCHLGPNSTICGRVSIGDSVFLGASSTILPYIKISSNIVVGAGGVVTRDLLDGSLPYTGIPAIQK